MRHSFMQNPDKKSADNKIRLFEQSFNIIPIRFQMLKNK